MSKDYSTSSLRRTGIRNSRSIQPKIVYIVLLEDVANGSSPVTYTRKMARSTGSAVGVRQKSVVFAMESGMARRIVQKTKRRTDFSKQQRRQGGNDVTTVGPWLS
jgi:hypothetical protein